MGHGTTHSHTKMNHEARWDVCRVGSMYIKDIMSPYFGKCDALHAGWQSSIAAYSNVGRQAGHTSRYLMMHDVHQLLTQPTLFLL